ncbi:PREDICTED: uncharacterized protein LOC104766666 [Camelina sativa]|uniref:Uncharacterized protein LOC104766666 n=1 Tax=Camelina sativa TaxID=90675 RepID=A0ABM1RBU2_CAMSA|nr:PREDICTED: uncharacterized protein LOC104766666 [Camelina sativa]
MGKTKDNIISRLDLPSICNRPHLHVLPSGRGPIPRFRLDGDAKDALFRWIVRKVKFPDRYASNLRNCVDNQEGISAFFITRSLTPAGIRQLADNIPVLICNLEKIFLPSFFRCDGGGEKPHYINQVPDIFSQIRRLSGKPTKRWLTEVELKHLHTYILLNCEELWPYERIYLEQLRTSYPHYDEETLATKKQNEFVQWMKFYVHTCNNRGERLHTWLEELVDGPLSLAQSSPTYYTR